MINEAGVALVMCMIPSGQVAIFLAPIYDISVVSFFHNADCKLNGM